MLRADDTSPAARLTRVDAGRWRLDGALTLAAVAELAAALPAAGEGGRAELDLAGVSQPSSAGVALLLDWRARLQADGATLVLHNVPRPMLSLAALGNVQALLGLGDPPRRSAPAPPPMVTSAGS
ncbi:STAS domain-containing protein [uncultured Thiohalocapsa sp.]|uniref:STAS domain-containing protein n=1 Tax=uncultured Thiohalocapsa sp. TaxID=768990 RepID=UPI0025CEF9F1|nr:STAS domain-containing protein [uncultured Thiohalocapsa sp.]